MLGLRLIRSAAAEIRRDVAVARSRDPAARGVGTIEVVATWPGVQALLAHRTAHALQEAGIPLLPRMIAAIARSVTGVEIHPAAQVGQGFFIDHGMGVVIGETAEVGDECTIYQGVTLGGTSLAKGAKRHPTLGRGVIVGANSQVLGGFVVGDDARIGSNAVVLKAVPPGATAVGNPARIIQAEADATREATAAKMGFSAYGLTQGDDPVSQAMKGLIDNASGHEHQIALLWQAIEKLSARSRELPTADCVPGEAHTTENFDAERLNRLVK
jgi:serine O-acetyltransferase